MTDSTQPEVPARSDKDVVVAIRLPLPLDVTATLGGLLDAAWPGAYIDLREDTSPRGWGYGATGTLNVRLPDATRRRPKRVSRKAAAALMEDPSDPAYEGQMARFEEDGTVTVLPPEELAVTIANSVRAALEDHPEAQNYLEWTLHDPTDPSRRYLVYACRSEGQTPHALREKAEAGLQAVLDLHSPVKWFEADPWSDELDMEKPLPPFCRECTDEEWVDSVEGGDVIDRESPVVSWPCKTVQAVHAAQGVTA